MRPYKNSVVQTRVGNAAWRQAFWNWLADGWGWTDTPFTSGVIIADSHDAPDCAGRSSAEIIRAALNVMAADPDYPMVRVKRGVYRFI